MLKNRLNYILYIVDLLNVLETFDVRLFDEFMIDHKSMYQPEMYQRIIEQDDSFKLGMMAKMTLQFDEADEDTRKKAMSILDELGWDYDIWNRGDLN